MSLEMAKASQPPETERRRPWTQSRIWVLGCAQRDAGSQQRARMQRSSVAGLRGLTMRGGRKWRSTSACVRLDGRRDGGMGLGRVHRREREGCSSSS